MMIICGETAAKDAPSSMLARKASLTAVSGNSLMNGCTTFGKFDDEKNTPEKIHIGSMMKFMMPDTASVVRAREALSNPNPPNEIAARTQISSKVASDLSNPNPPNEIAARTQISSKVASDPRRGTPKAQ